MDNHPQKIRYLIITAHTLPLTAGGGIHAFSFARFLTKYSDEVTILTVNPDKNLPKIEFVDEVRILRKRVSRKNRANRIISYTRMIPSVIHIVKQADVIIIYGRYFVLHKLIIIAGKLLGKFVIFRSTMMGEDDFDTLLTGNWFLAWIRRTIYSCISLYFAITPEFSEKFRKHYSRKIVFESPQGVDTEKFSPVSKTRKKELKMEFGIPEGVPALLSAGSLLHRKAYREIFTILSEKSSAFIYIIAAETELFLSPHLEKHIGEIMETKVTGEKLLGSRIRFIGMVDNLDDWFNVADIFILNSRQEGLSNSLLECLASRTTALIRDSGGLEDYVISDGRNALVYKDVSEFDEIISRLLEKPQDIPVFQSEFSDLVRQKISFENVFKEISKSISGISDNGSK